MVIFSHDIWVEYLGVCRLLERSHKANFGVGYYCGQQQIPKFKKKTDHEKT